MKLQTISMHKDNYAKLENFIRFELEYLYNHQYSLESRSKNSIYEAHYRKTNIKRKSIDMTVYKNIFKDKYNILPNKDGNDIYEDIIENWSSYNIKVDKEFGFEFTDDQVYNINFYSKRED